MTLASAIQCGSAPHPVELQSIYRRDSHRALTSLPRVVQNIAELFDGTRTTEEVLHAAQISVERGLAVVRKLSSLGIIRTSVAQDQGKLEREETLRGMPVLGKQEREETLRGMPVLGQDPGKLEREDTLRGMPVLGSVGFSAADEAFFASEPNEPDDCELRHEGWADRAGFFILDLVLKLRRSPVL